MKKILTCLCVLGGLPPCDEDITQSSGCDGKRSSGCDDEGTEQSGGCDGEQPFGGPYHVLDL